MDNGSHGSQLSHNVSARCRLPAACVVTFAAGLSTVSAAVCLATIRISFTLVSRPTKNRKPHTLHITGSRSGNACHLQLGFLSAASSTLSLGHCQWPSHLILLCSLVVPPSIPHRCASLCLPVAVAVSQPIMSANTSHKVTEAAGSPHPSKRRFSATNGTPPSSTRSPLNGSPANGSNKRQHLEAVDDRLNAIEEHGVIGNMRTCALISVSAEVCWFCYPNFDSPSIFASILDRDKGGSWTISAYIEDGKDTVHNASSNHHVDFDFPAHEHDSTPTTLPPAPPTVSNPSSRAQSRNNPQAGKKQPSKTTAEHQQQRELVRRYVTHKQLYHSDTNVLISRFLSEDGVGQVLDYMPAGKVTESAKRWLVRELTVVRGQMTFQVTLTPAFNYARDTHTVAIEPYGARFVSDKLAMELRTTKKLQWDLTDDGKGVTCLVELNENEREVFIFCESERCPGGDWKTGSSEGDALFVANEPKQKDDVRHEWNEGVDEVVNPPAEADGSPRTGKDSTLHNGSGKEHEAKADDGKEVEAEADDAKQAEPQRPAEKKEEANAPKDGESSGSGAVAAEGEKGWIRKALGEIVWRSTSSLARTLDEEWEAKQDAQRAMGRQSSRNRQLSRNKSMQRTASAASTKSSHAVKNNSNNSNTTAPSKDTGTAASDACVIDKDMDDATDGKDADDGDSHPSDNDAGSDNVILSDDDLNMSDDDDDNDDQSDDDGTGNDSHSIRRVTVDVAAKLRDHTINFWREWIGKCTYNGRWREVVYRSALVLKLMTFEPTGAIVAALTTSLPEEVKGERNWDYRFTWIRDSSFVLYAFLKLGFKEEASSFMQWISQRCEESTMTDGSLQIMYGLHGEHKLEEKQLTHLAGYKDSAPVRIGNDAYAQVQLDIYGELMDTVYLSNKVQYSLAHNRLVSSCRR